MKVRDCKDCDEKRERAHKRNLAMPRCNKCGRRMQRSLALVNMLGRGGEPVHEGSTVWADGAVTVPCWKCVACGHSVTL